jgi:hypothetical protein
MAPSGGSALIGENARNLPRSRTSEANKPHLDLTWIKGADLAGVFEL